MKRIIHAGAVVVLAIGFTLAMAGCGVIGSLPDSVDVQLPDGTTQTATLGAGVPSLANSTWIFFEGGGPAFMTITFGPGGELTRFDDNTLAQEVFGDTVHFDGESHQAGQQGLSYIAATYGAQTADATGFAFEGRMTAFAAGLKAAEATASASGTFDADNPDRMTGVFSFTSEVTIASIPGANLNEEFEFVAERAE
jgi:hypothetical protein